MTNGRGGKGYWRQMILCASLIATALGSSSVSRAAAPSEPRIMLVAERTTTGPSWFDFEISAQAAERGGFIGSLDGVVRAGRVVKIWPGQATSFGRAGGPGVYSSGSSLSTCEVGVCGSYSAIQSVEFEDGTGDDPMNRMFVAAWGSDIDYEFQADGWVLKPVDWGFSFTDGRDSHATGANVGPRGGEIFFEAQLRGGRYGSVAQAMPPCSTSTVSAVPRGVGRATLEGGRKAETMVCPTDQQATVASWSSRPTMWRLVGQVAGDTSVAETRLFVIHLPRQM